MVHRFSIDSDFLFLYAILLEIQSSYLNHFVANLRDFLDQYSKIILFVYLIFNKD